MGMPRDDPDVKYAIGLLERAERTLPSQASADDFAEALQTLDAYRDFDPQDAAASEFVANLKYAYTRQVLTRLREIDARDFSTWFPYVALLFGRMREQCEQLRRSHPQLGEIFDDCLRAHRAQIEQALGRGP